ncbi:type III secretion system export apparatus subunit SctV [Pararoseomonas sp. SCSIO 73927]|uniref:type III secretion system export apparatus subunit SctV n=1 Tax=Pararoseomonas sp. SCSIO 73927 TaxID=3114537 RepID=UPI0030CB2A92
MRRLLARLPYRSDLAVAALMVATILLMIIPLPTILVDMLLSLSLGSAVLLLMVGFYLRSPVEFSTLPAVILITTVFRLALAIATTRLILLQADAGEIVRVFGEFVVGGNIVVGLVVFLIITVVQFVVITKGSERVAEVAARFTLDAMPGKQMAIDADLRAGDIDQPEARRRRSALERESQLFGAMDGAMKFVKGDAIAGLVIIVVNLIGGLAVGTTQHGMSLGQAAHTFSILTVGDGLVSQIPALFVSITAGIVVTRVAGGENSTADSLGGEITGQLLAEPRALWLAAVVAFLLGLIPGFPMIILFALAAGLFLLGTAAARRRRGEAERVEEARAAAAAPDAESAVDAPVPPGRVRLLLAPALLESIPAPRLRAALAAAGAAAASATGAPVPGVSPQPEEGLPEGGFRLEVDTVPIAEGVLPPDSVLLRDEPENAALAGVPLAEGAELPGLPRPLWAGREHLPALVSTGIGHAEPPEILAEIAGRALRRHAAQFVGLQEARAMIGHLEGSYGDLVREALRAVPLQRAAEVMRRLLEEGVSVRNMRGLLEGFVEHGDRESDAAGLAEASRAGLRRQICHAHVDRDRVIPAFVMDAGSEETVRASVRHTPAGTFLALPEGMAAALAERLRAELVSSNGPQPVILCALDIRRHIRSLLVNNGVDVSVLSFQDLSPEFTVQPLGSVRLHGAPGDAVVQRVVPGTADAASFRMTTSDAA